MTERVVKVSLTAQVSNYLAGMEQARKKTSEVGSEAEKAKAKVEAQAQAMQQIGTGLLAIGAVAAVGVGMAIKKFADFDAAMSEVQASTHESAENMGLLRDAAIEAGASTVFTATEAANAIDELSKAGVSAADVLGGALAGSLDLASAGGLGVADAASIAATALTQFKLEGSDIPHVADLLAAGAGKAQGSVQDLGAALAQGGLVASQAGMSLDETTGALAAFASAGLIGSDAGTSLKTMLLALEKPSGKAAQLMEDYGISVYDNQGKMLGMSEIAGQLQAGLKDLTDEQRNSALATIFGTDAVRSASVLYDQGAKGIDSWNKKVNDSGYAAETARIKLDNLNGDVEKLGGAFDTALIKAGSASDFALRGLVQTVTQLVDIFGSAPLGVQQVALALGVLTAGASLAGGAFLLGVPKIAQFQVALAQLAASEIPAVAAAAVGMQGAVVKSGAALATTAKFLTGPWGVALAAAAVGVALLSSYLDSLQATSTEVSNSLATAGTAAQVFATVGKGKDVKWLQDVKGQLKDLPDVLQASADQAGNLFARFDSSHFGAFDALKEIGTELGSIASSDLPSAQKAFRMLTDETDGTEQSQWRLLNTMPGYKDALTAQAKALGINVTSTDEAANKAALLGLAFGEATPSAYESADAYLEVANQVTDLDEKLKSLIDAMDAINGVGQSAVETNAAWQGALAGIGDEIQKQKDDLIQGQKDVYEELHGNLDGFTEDLSGFTFSLDESTEAGSANAAMLSDVADKAQSAALAQYEVDKTTMSAKDATDKYLATLAANKQAMEDQATANGANADQVQILSDKIYALPNEKAVKILTDTADAQRGFDDFIQRNTGHSISIIAKAGGMVASTYDTGGYTGAGGKYEPAGIVHKAEFVSTAETTAKPENRAALEWMHRGGTIKGYAGGGFVGYASPVQYVSSGYGSGGNSSTSTSTTDARMYVTAIGSDPNEVASKVQAKQDWARRNGR